MIGCAYKLIIKAGRLSIAKLNLSKMKVCNSHHRGMRVNDTKSQAQALEMKKEKIAKRNK